MQLNFLFFFMLFTFSLYGQSLQHITGTVVDKSSYEPIIGANIYTPDYKFGTTTNAYGQYTLAVESHYQELVSSYIGFRQDTIEIPSNGICNFELNIEQLEEVVVTAKQVTQPEMGRFTPPVAALKKIPTLLGEVDLVKSLTLLPGVSGGIEGTSGLIVRGGNTSNNLILLDGVPVYNATHLFGFISSFNPAAVKYVELIKGGFPAQYGGRLASVLNINLKEGNFRKRNTELSLGVINSSFLTEGPIVKDKASYMLSARSSNLGILLSPLYLAYKSGAKKDYFNYGMYDLNAKVNYKISPYQSIYISYFHSADRLSFLKKESKAKGGRQVKWGNQVVALRYNNKLSRSILIDAGMYFNEYNFRTRLTASDSLITTKETTRTAIQDFSFKTKINWNVGKYSNLKFGVDIGRRTFTPIDNGQFATHRDAGVLENESSKDVLSVWETVVFADEQIRLTDWLNVNIGARSFLYNGQDNAQYIGIEPRLNVKAKLGKVDVKIAYDVMHQTAHLLTTVGNLNPNELWIPSNKNLAPSNSRQLSLGLAMPIKPKGLGVSLEFFGKKMNNLVRYRPGATYLFSQDKSWEKNVVGDGIGVAYGAELFVNIERGRLSGWLGYTLSWSDRQFPTVNKGRWFPANFDRRHDLELTGSYRINDKWSVASTFIFQTGRSITYPSAFYRTPPSNGELFPTYVVEFDRINGDKTSPYHRLDLSFSKDWVSRKGREKQISFGAYNVYFHNNAFLYGATFDAYGEKVNMPELVLTQKSFFNFIPSFNYSIKL